MRRIAESMLLGGFGAMFLYMYYSGDIALYIHPRFHLITLITGFVLAGLALARLLISGQSGCTPLNPVNYSLFLLPLLLVLLLPSRVLDTGMASRRGIVLEAPAIIASWRIPVVGILRLDSANYLDVLTQLYQQPSRYKGRAIQLEGFVFQPEEYGENTFITARFAISCCIADATVVGFLAKWPQAATPEENQWVRLTGLVTPRLVNGQLIPMLEVYELELIDPLPSPYVFINY